MGIFTRACDAPSSLSRTKARKIDRMLSALRSYLDMDVAFLTEFVGDERIFHCIDATSGILDLLPGERLPLATGFCERVAKGLLPELITDAATVPAAAALAETIGISIGAHLSVPVRLPDGRVFGTFCCFSRAPRPDLGLRDLKLVRDLADIVAKEISLEAEKGREQAEKTERVRAAIAYGDPRLVFQPIVRLSDMKVSGVEALSRFASQPWRAPDIWFEEAKDVDLGLELEIAATKTALRQAFRLPAEWTININLSPDALLSPDAHALLRGFDPKRIVVELTEHVPVANYAREERALASLREAGMRVAIDDVGAGYSSLRHALDLNPDILKFDTSLIRGIDGDARRQAMIAALMEYARRTSTHTVGEGVETIKELQTLVELGVEEAQGFLFSSPKSMSDLLLDWSATAP